MYNIVYDITSVLTASVIFSMMFIILYAIEKKTYLIYWCLSWLSFSLILIVELVHILRPISYHFPFIYLSVGFISGYFLLIGALNFVSSRRTLPATKITSALFVIGTLLYFSPVSGSFSKLYFQVLTASIFVVSGYHIFKHTRKFSLGGKLAGASIIFWGMQKIDYHFVINVPWFEEAGYHIAVLLTLTSASGIILLHFEKVKKDLREREVNFRRIAEVSDDIIFIVNYGSEMTLKYLNPAVERITGYSIAEVLRSEELQERFFKNFLMKMQREHKTEPAHKFGTNTYESEAKSGKKLILEYSYTNYYALDGSIDQTIGYIKDVTKDILAFDTLVDRQDWYEAIFQKSIAMQMLVNAETGLIVDANNPLRDFYKYGINELRTMKIDDLFISGRESEYFWHVSSRGERPEKFQTLDKKGGIKTVQVSYSPLFFDNVKYLYLNFADITTELYFQKELRNISTLQSAILESLNEGVMGINEKGEIFFINTFAQKLLGYNAHELIGQNPHMVLHHPSEEGHIGIDKCPVMSFLHNDEEFIQYRDYMAHKDGTVFSIDITVSDLKYYNSSKNCIIIFKDITKELQSEQDMLQQIEENSVLLREVHHRVKNNLQIISSLLSLQIDAVEDDKHARHLNDSIARIRSMAIIHELLYQTKGLNALSIKFYLERLLLDLKTMFTVNEDIRIITEIDDFSISIDRAVPIGLIATELFTNSMKHAFNKNQRNKKIHVGLKEYGDNYVFWLKDNGKGLENGNDINTAKSLGFTVIKSLTKQLKGDIEHQNDDGLNTKLSFPQA